MVEPLTGEEILGRIGRLRALLEKQGVCGALVVQKADLYYFSGTDQDAHLWIPASGPPLLMVKKSMQRAAADSPLDEPVPLTGLSAVPGLVREALGRDPERLGLELDVIPAALYLQYLKLFPKARPVDVSGLIRRVRMVKTPYEISRIREAAELGDRLLERIPEFLLESKNETELALRAEGFYRENGHPGLTRTRAFNAEATYGHILTGKSGAVPGGTFGPTAGPGLGPWFSQGAGWGRIRPNEPVMVDYTAASAGYTADQARVFSLGKLPEELTRACGVMREIQDAVAAAGSPGTPAAELYALAIRMAREAGLESGFMGYPEPVSFLGHGVGLELDEWPVISDRGSFVLKEGMVVALEPKVVFPGRGVVGVENNFVVRPEGMERLNRFPDAPVMV